MEKTPTHPAPDRRGPSALRTTGSLAFACLLTLAACTNHGSRHDDELDADGRPTEAELQRIASSALPTGNVAVRFIDGVAYVTGNVATAIEANAVVRALNGVDGVDRVETLIRRRM